ncbi:MAG: type II secretion system F family protein [Candidatus Brocadiaceae bacterium]|nr:type II secretion system F family protein [Candidatus Brocadiaceae bacterium]
MDNPLVLAGIFVGVVGLFVAVGVFLQKRRGPRTLDNWDIAGKGAGPVVLKPSGRRPRRQYGEGFMARMVRPLASFWRFGDSSQSKLQELLVHAGIRQKGAVEVFLGARLALALALPAGVVVFLLSRTNVTAHHLNPRALFLYGSMALIVGILAPMYWLRGKARRRIQKVRFALPDMLDLLIVCVESGLGLDAALIRISRELQESAPELAEDLILLNLEISAGKPREECLRNLALRSGSDELESLAARINQAAKFGTNLGNSLRIHSESLRQKRRQEAEERAAKTSVKLLFPLVFCIFPAIFVVILGPAMVDMMEFFGS